ncbi:MAG: phage major capsid protein [Comamonadaceae bacterium]|nr:MAG: phage major capsid protein [Comamonadaceae bacterium]
MKKSLVSLAVVAAMFSIAAGSAHAVALQKVADLAAAQPVPRGILAVRADAGTSPGEIKALVDGMNKAFADFKAEHTRQLDEIKANRSGADQEAAIQKINSHLDRLQKETEDAHTKLASAQMGVGEKTVVDKEYSAAFRAHFTKGDVQAALNKGVATEGGYLAPVEWDRSITDRLIEVSPIRSIASVQSISTAGYTKLFNNRGATSGWVGETAPRPQTNTPTFSPLTYKPGELYANPAATQQLLDDSEINLEAWLANEVETEFAYQEGIAFLTGTGANDRPNGLLTYVTGGTNAATHPWGDIKTVGSGAVGAVTADSLIDLIYALPDEYTANARFVLNRTAQGVIRKLKDGQGNYLWQPSYVAGQPATIAGYPVTTVAGMPNIAANAVVALFGDFKRGYQIVDRTGVRVLRDPYTNKPFVQFYTTKRVGGGLLNPDVIKALKVNAA